jgi:hypothetical protein
MVKICFTGHDSGSPVPATGMDGTLQPIRSGLGAIGRRHNPRSFVLERSFTTLTAVRTWEANDPNFGRPIAAPLERCAELLGVDLATIRELAAKVEPYIRSDGARIWSLMQLERQLRPEAYRRRRGGYLDRRRIPATDA